MRKLKNILLLSSILIITVAFNFQHNPSSGWYQQFLPSGLGSQNVNDMQFLDSLNGYMITSRNVNPDTASILKTTDGGDNWTTVFSQGSRRFSRIKFINNTTGFAIGGTNTGQAYLYKTTSAGVNWFIQSNFGCAFWDDMYVLNEDTIWAVDKGSLCGGVFRTTNGGSSWVQQGSFSINPEKVYFYNARIGYIANVGGQYLRKTTDGGATWNLISSTEGFTDIHFTDSLTGWRAWGTMKKTTDGGLSWVNQPLPWQQGVSNISAFSVLNKDTIWGVGGYYTYANNTKRATVYTTTNGGTNWLYQVPDTVQVTLFKYTQIQFLNRSKGWAYAPNGGIHTKVGGDPLTSVAPISSEIPNDFILYQNYPNPFNPTTVINYQLTISSFVTLKVYDLQGKEITSLINKKQSAGNYSVEFNAANLSSGIYFYTLQTENYKETKKMMLVK